jgi:hypothetical protein
MQQIYQFCIKIYHLNILKLKLTVSNFPFSITIHVFLFPDSNSSVSALSEVDPGLYKFFLSLTATLTSQDINISS